jgi:hypothetical protein
MGINLKVGDVELAVASSADCVRLLEQQTSLAQDFVIQFQDSTNPVLNGATIASLPDDKSELRFTINRKAMWRVANSQIWFSLKPSSAGLVSFTKTPPSTEKTGDEPPPTQFHVSIRMAFTPESTTVDFAHGFNMALAPEGRLISEHRQSLPGGTSVSSALQTAFSKLAFPFCAESILALESGDLLEFDFPGRLAAGMGLIHDLQSRHIGGRSVGDITRSFSNELALALLTASPAVRGSETFALPYSHQGVFLFRFTREKTSTANCATLSIFRSKEASAGHPRIEFAPNAAYDFAAGAADVLSGALADLLRSTRESGSETVMSSLRQKISEAAPEIAQLTRFINESVGTLLARTAGKTQLELILQAADRDKPLYELVFDLSDGDQSPVSLDRALEGAISRAVAFSTVVIGPQSFIENLFRARSGFSFEFFNLWEWETLPAYFDHIQIRYAGEARSGSPPGSLPSRPEFSGRTRGSRPTF